MIEFLKKLFLAIFVIFCFFLVGAFIFIRSNGKGIVEDKLSQAFGKPVTVRNVGISFPLSLRIDSLEVKEALTIKGMDVQISLANISTRELVLSHVKLDAPEITIKRTKESEVILGDTKVVEKKKKKRGFWPLGKKEEEDVSEEKTAMGIFVKFLEVEDGKVHFSDQSSGKDFKLDLNKLSLKARSIAYPLKSVDSKFKLSADIKSDNIPFSASRVEAEGWVNIIDRNMDSTIKLMKPGGGASLSANLKSQDNVMAVKGSMDVGGIKKKEGQEEDDSIEGFIFGAMEEAGVDIKMDFAFETKMDDFRIEPIELSGTVGKEESFESIGEGFKKIGEQFEAFGKKFYEDNIKPQEEQEEQEPQVQQESAQ